MQQVPYKLIGSPDLKFTDIASAATVNLDAAVGNYGQITGTNAITAITLSEGKAVWVRFTGALTLTNGANLVLPGAVNLTTAAGDWALFIAIGAVVYCVDRRRADGTSVVAGLTTAGLIDASGAAAGQIKFPGTQNPSTNVNTLDDYSEGTFTPSVGGTATYTLQNGQYIKIGKVVYFQLQLAINVIGTGSTSEISGLPYSTGGLPSAATVSNYSGLALSVVSMTPLITVGAPPVVRFMSQTIASAAQAQNAVLGNASAVVVSGFYFAAN